MTNVTNRMIAACAGTIAFACAAIPGANAADIPVVPQYGGPPVVQERYVQERYVYQEPPRAYYQPAPPPVVYQEYAPPELVPVPSPYAETYYVPPRRVYVGPGYGAYGYRPYIAGGYGYHRGWGHQHHRHAHRRW